MYVMALALVFFFSASPGHITGVITKGQSKFNSSQA
jgi:hypothetical protein